MYSKKIKYEDYDGNEREVEAYFNLNKAELLELQLSWDGGLEKVLEKIIAEKDQKRMIEMFKMIILKAYGEKSLDGNRFIKTPEVVEAFTQTEAYSELFMELATDDKAAAEFINGIMPKKLLEEAQKLQDEQGKANVTALPQN
ncbi:MAG: hypothetical protein J6Y02_16900 [Pseudobutyrivibrio sp.]|nr:hypothetical protein [Pseudobutyrivibrio sp.]